ncbi:GTPase Era [Candidatus Enterovibrio escicola]|uniref:GTPase Era n=1 Tax=Candidatus Enterovibrio escicola TaxID=1927127 RepID=A0A2A5T6R7_9GAMM|nr:GTPase Era [Candidatus Enterovibrio escacola]PCS23790.1 GTP-binding protein Era [Candidatus Enterovibrio escacola]
MTDTSQIHYCGFISIVGRPNVGKSTLLNRLLGQKLSITSSKPQTTRHCIMGVDTRDGYQAVYVDTPGIHIEEKQAINRLMNRAALSSLNDVELILFLVSGTHWTTVDDMILKKLIKADLPTVLLINKVDKIREKGVLLPYLQALSEKMYFVDIIPISAKNSINIDVVEKRVRQALPEGEWNFPKEYLTDRSQRFMASEIILEKLMRFTGDELPYAVTVEIERFDYNQDTGGFEINGLILVNRNSQKKMVIGKGGDKIKTIGREARLGMELLFERKVYLDLWVKVKSGWADDERALRSLGYIDQL